MGVVASTVPVAVTSTEFSFVHREKFSTCYPSNHVYLFHPLFLFYNSIKSELLGGAGFDPSSTVEVTLDGAPITTTPATVTTTPNGVFFANFTVPISTPGPHTVEADTTRDLIQLQETLM